MGKSKVSSEVVAVSQDEMMMKMTKELTSIKSKVKVHDKVVFVFSLVVVLFISLVLATSLK